MMQRLSRFLMVSALAGAGGAACNSPDIQAGPGAVDPNAPASVGYRPGDGGAPPLPEAPPPVSTLPGDPAGGMGPNACAAQSYKAEPRPLDIFLLMDSSGSMTGLTGGGVTKWDAVRTALTSFVGDARSVGIGVGLHLFPNAPASCQEDADCGAFGPCGRATTICTLATPARSGRTCTQDSQCNGGACVALGRCSKSTNLSCTNYGQPCGTDPADVCNKVDRQCANISAAGCQKTDYAPPLVAIAPLPQPAAEIATTLETRKPAGSTPLGPAVVGVLEHLKERARANPDRRVALVIVSDGQPSRCQGTALPWDVGGISNLLRAANDEAPAIPSFVVGVLARNEAASGRASLDRLATAGGTKTALVVSSEDDVGQKFLGALNEIRAAALPCEYPIPKPAGGSVDFDKVNLQFTPGGGAAGVVGAVTDPMKCQAGRDAWHYNVKPETGAPSAVVLCPGTCEKIKSDVRGKVDVLIGCQTKLID